MKHYQPIHYSGGFYGPIRQTTVLQHTPNPPLA